MTVQSFFSVLRKRAWIILLTTLLAISIAYLISLRIQPTYQSQTTLLVGKLAQDPSTSSNSAATDAQLAQTHAFLVKKPALLEAVADTVQYPGGWQELFFKVDTRVTGGQVLEITVTDNDPARAKLVADQIAQQLILQSPLNAQNTELTAQRDFIVREQTTMQSEIEQAREKLAALNQQAKLENDPAKARDLNSQIDVLQTKIEKWQDTYINLSGLLKSPDPSFITVLLPADLPVTPISPNFLRNLTLAAALGLVLGGAIIYLLEYTDNTIKSPEDIQRLLDLATLSTVTRISGVRELRDTLVTASQPRSPVSESFRSLRTNLRFAGLENPGGALLVTSAGPGEGKSTAVANLAVASAQAGKQVILVDTDLRRPSIHKIFGVSKSKGLSTLFLEDPPPLKEVLQETHVRGLHILTTGKIPPNPAEMLDSKLMAQIITELRSVAELVLFDSPPVLAVADPVITGSRCSGAVLVLEAGKTRVDAAERAVDHLHRANIRIFGAILNRQSAKRASAYSYYHYASASEDSEEEATG